LYWLLAEAITAEDATLLSEWRNSDQNQSQFNSEMQLIRSIQRVCNFELQLNSQVKLATIVAKITCNSLVKLQPNTVGALSKFVMEMGSGEYIDQLANWHANNVNPQEISCSTKFYEDVTTSVHKRFVLVRLGICIAQYNNDCVTERTRPLPDSCKFISGAELASIAKMPDVLDKTEKFLVETRTAVQPIMTKLSTPSTAMNFIHLFETQVVRFILNKPPHAGFAGVVGKFDELKLLQVRINWLLHIQGSCDSLQNLASEAFIRLQIVSLLRVVHWL
jgi:hypothetical protein